MEIRYIQEFLTLAEYENYHTAARHLEISQSTLTSHIKAMEKELGVSLFERSTRNVSLSEYGQMFYTYAEHFTGIYNDFLRRIKVKRYRDRETILIAMPPNQPLDGMNRLLSDFSREPENANLVVELMCVPEQLLREMLQYGRCHIVIAPSFSAQDSEFGVINLREDFAVALATEKYLATENAQVEIDLLKEKRLLMPHVSTVIYRMLKNKFEELGYEMNIACEGVSDMTGITMANKGEAVYISSNHFFEFFRGDTLRAAKIIPEMRWNVNLLYKENTAEPAVLRFLDYVRQNLSLDE